MVDVYRGYLIKKDLSGTHHVSKEGAHITSQPSREAAEHQINMLHGDDGHEKAWATRKSKYGPSGSSMSKATAKLARDHYK